MRLLLYFLLLLCFISCSNSLAPNKVDSKSIRFDVTETSYVEVWIENSYQTKVITVVAQQLGPGTYEYPYKMRNLNGKPLPYGLYTVWFKSKTFSSSLPIIYQSDS